MTRATASAVKGSSLRSTADAGDEAGVHLLVLGRALDDRVEVGPHLEQLLEVRVLRVEQVVDERLADEDDLGAEGDGLGIERGGRGEAHLLGDVFDADLAGLERALERILRVGLGQELAGLEHEEAAVGLVESSRL